ncbi:hypothetical protein [Modestobacter sp. DSM 44400]|uniref:hypothetical protein n=1 Tax=Modestobacter sp. DSM 44400 TaxID=1550230 RepID=UPI00352A6ED1
MAADGHREVLGYTVGDSEDGAFCAASCARQSPAAGNSSRIATAHVSSRSANHRARIAPRSQQGQ